MKNVRDKIATELRGRPSLCRVRQGAASDFGACRDGGRELY